MATITPTEPIPTEAGSTITYEQGERLIQLLTDQHEADQKQIHDLTLLINNPETPEKDSLLEMLPDQHGQVMQQLQGISDNQTVIKTDLHDTVLSQLQTISENTGHTATTVGQTTSMTFDQGQDLLNGLHQINEVVAYGAVCFFLYFVFRWLFRFFGGTVFGGL